MNITIYIPAYNEETYIQRAIDSSCTQKNTEVVVIDDCSTDKTYEISTSLQQKYSNLKVYRNEKKSENWQQAVASYADTFSGRHIIGLGADDFLISGISESCSKFLDVGVIFHNFAVVNSEGTVDHIVHMGYPHTIKMSSEQVIERIRSPFMATETGVASSIRKDCFQWLCDLRFWELEAWADAIAYPAVAAKFGATYIPLVGGCFTKFHSNGKISYGDGCANNPILVSKISTIAKDFLKRAEIDDYTAAFIMKKRDLIV